MLAWLDRPFVIEYPDALRDHVHALARRLATGTAGPAVNAPATRGHGREEGGAQTSWGGCPLSMSVCQARPSSPERQTGSPVRRGDLIIMFVCCACPARGGWSVSFP